MHFIDFVTNIAFGMRDFPEKAKLGPQAKSFVQGQLLSEKAKFLKFGIEKAKLVTLVLMAYSQ